MFRSFRRVDWRTNWEAPTCECPRFKLNHCLDVLDLFPRELQWYHRVCGVTHLSETKGEPKARKTVLHSGKGKEPLTAHSSAAAQPRRPGDAGRALQEMRSTTRCIVSNVTESLERNREINVHGSWVTFIFLFYLRMATFLSLSFLIQKNLLSFYHVSSSRRDGDLESFYVMPLQSLQSRMRKMDKLACNYYLK